MRVTTPPPPAAGIEVYESPLRLKNLRVLSHADAGAANSENVQLSALICIGVRAAKSAKPGLAKLARAWKLGMNVSAPNSSPAIMTGLRPIRSDSAPQRTMRGVPSAKPTAKIA